MKKYFIVSATLVLFSLFSNAQDTRAHIEKALTHPKATENAAKADALLIDKKAIKDDTAHDRNKQAIRKGESHSKKTKRVYPGKKNNK